MLCAAKVYRNLDILEKNSRQVKRPEVGKQNYYGLIEERLNVMQLCQRNETDICSIQFPNSFLTC